jgi:DNA polymerase-3 subunit beta
MKLKVSRTAILDVLQILQGIITTRTTLPILANVLLKADKKQLWLTTTDLEVSVKCGVDAEIIKGGASTLPARRLMSIIRELPADDVEIDIDEKNTATIKCGSSLFKIMGLSDDEFPPLPDLKDGNSYTVEQGSFKQMLGNIAYGASTDETRYVLNGIYLGMKADKMTMVATDGRRLALIEKDMELPKEAEADMIIPSKAVRELLHALGDDGDVKIYGGKNQVAFEFGTTLVVSKLIEGAYPNYKQVIPAQSDERVQLERETLLTAVKRVALLTSDKSSSVKLAFGKNKVKISAVTPDVGEAHETLSIKYSGKEIAVAFNPEYLMDPLRHLTCDEVYLELTDELSPGVLKCDVPFLYVIMPMRIN